MLDPRAREITRVLRRRGRFTYHLELSCGHEARRRLRCALPARLICERCPGEGGIKSDRAGRA